MRLRRVLSLACLSLTALAIASPAVAAPVSAPLLTAACSMPPAAGISARPRPIAAQVRHVDRAEITFHGRLTREGAIQIEGRGGELTFRKTSSADGRFTMDLEGPGDKVAISLSQDSITVSRNRRRVVLSLAAPNDKDLDRARVLLAGSKAVRLTRVAAEALQEAEDNSASGISLLIGDALIGMLTGDEGAPRRLARHLARHVTSGVRRVATTDCYGEWERRVLRASYEWESCASAFSVWNPIRNVCAFRWTLQIESYWFTFLSCTGFNAF
jgi:hypothetical protein